MTTPDSQYDTHQRRLTHAFAKGYSMADSDTKSDSSARVQIIVAVIGLAGVIATALISNWDRISSHKAPDTVPSVNSQTGAAKKSSERTVHSNGHVTIRGTYMFDLDRGREAKTGADFWWEQKTSVIRFLTPENGAAFYVVGPTSFESVKWSDMEHFGYSGAKIDASANASNRIPASTVVAYRTKEGRLGKFVVDQYGYDLMIRWRTFD
jgi:hypothetical protein